jgi:hypothetical protein
VFYLEQSSSSYCCGCYIVPNYCLRFDRGAVHIAVAGYIVDHWCSMFDRGVVHIVMAVILFPITISGLTEERSILLRLVILLTIMFNV